MATLARRSLVGSLFVVAPLAVGCSAIVAPDPGRLGAGDTGGPALDAAGLDAAGLDAAGLDAGRSDTGAPVDAYSPFDAYTPIDTGLPGTDAGSDGGPVCPPSCDDGVACTADACEGGRCVHTPDDALCPGERCNPTMGCVPIECTTDAECDDGDRCNGTERCRPGGSPTGCVAAERPLDCNDGAACTDDACDPVMGCLHARVDARCDDRIACTTDVCTGTAGPSGCEYRLSDAVCNTGCTMGARCTPSGCAGGSPLVCMDDGTPCTVERCDAAAGGCVRDPLDADMDGFPASRVVSGGTTFMCAGGADCDDTRSAVNPRATEVCGNGLDDDCNPSTSDVCSTPTGDTCAAPTPIPIASGRGSVTVTLTSFADDYDTRCGGGRGNDAVFYFDVTTTSDVRIETTGAVDTVLATAFRCEADAFRNRCNDDRNPGTNTTSRIWLHPVTVPAGMPSVRVFVLVDEFDVGDADPVTISVTLTAPPAVNACPTSTGPRPLDISGGGTVIGTLGGLGGAVGGQRGSCQPVASVGSEAVFRIEETDRVLDGVEASSTSFVPDLYVRGGLCASGTEIRCVNGSGSGSGGSATLTGLMHPSASGTVFYAFVDNAPLTSVEYTLDLDP
jgi:hypothetical protein